MSFEAYTALMPRQGVSEPFLEYCSDTDFSLVSEKKRYSLRFRPENFSVINTACASCLPLGIGRSLRSDDRTVFHLGPDEWHIITGSEDDIPALLSSVTEPHGLVDISHRQIAFEIMGENATSLINTGCPLDLSIGSFPVGKATRSIFERVPIILERRGEKAFYVELWRSFSPYFVEMIKKSALVNCENLV